MSSHQQIVWITGASSGIGKEMALQYAAKGYSVAASARRTDLLESLVTVIKSKGGTALAVECDVTKEESIANAIKTVATHYGKIDIAVANAGSGVVGFFQYCGDKEQARTVYQKALEVHPCYNIVERWIRELDKEVATEQ